MIFEEGVEEMWDLIKGLNESDFVEEIGLELPYILSSADDLKNSITY